MERETAMEEIDKALQHVARCSFDDPAQSLKDDLGLDSLERIELMIELEKNIPGLKISDEQASDAKTIEDVIALIVDNS